MSKRTYTLKSQGIIYKVEVEESDGNYTITGSCERPNGRRSKLKPFKGNAIKNGDYYYIKGDSYNATAIIEKDGNRTWIIGSGVCAPVERSASDIEQVKKKGFKPVITAPITGKAVKLNVKESSALEKDDVIIVIEAMKMEFQIKAEHKCKVKKILVKQGQLIEQGEPLVELHK